MSTREDEARRDAGAAGRTQRREQRRGRARKRLAYLAERAGEYDPAALNEAMARLLATPEPAPEPAPPAGRPARGRARKRVRKAFPTGDAQRWVPIGPSVVRNGQAEGSPRVTGRIRDPAVSPDGTRAYAASAKGGVWYTADAGATWNPVGGWADRAARRGGSNNAQACACLLVHFGDTPADDYVLVGTGEPHPWLSAASWSPQGGIGVLAASRPATLTVDQNPWEAEAGLDVLEGRAVYRLARRPGATPGKATDADADRVLAATTRGLFLGTRSHHDGPPARDEWNWVRVTGFHTSAVARTRVTDVVWLPGGANGRVFVAVNGAGVAFSDDIDDATAWQWVANLDPGTMASPVVGRLSLAHATGNRVYVLGELAVGGPPAVNTPTLWQIANADAAAPATPSATTVPGVPAGIWPGQRDYDQAIAVEVTGATDRIYLGGSTVRPYAAGEWAASLWCFETAVPPTPLAPVAGISTTGAPPAGAGADQAGLIGNNVHADVHAIRLTGTAGAGRQVWVGCDGGVFVSAQAGRCNSFLSRATGLAALEPGFLAQHPESGHFLAIGCQDNGTQVRTGDTLWDETMKGDGGGLVFHPRRPVNLVAQYLQGTWLGRPTGGFRDPLHRAAGGVYEGDPPDREHALASFYSSAAAIPLDATTARVAVGTNRVWIADNIGGGGATQWRVLPVQPAGPPPPAPAAAADARPGGNDPPGNHAIGVPPGVALGGVTALRWVTPRDLLAVYQWGLVRYTQDGAGLWLGTRLVPGIASAPDPANTVYTDVCPVPGTQEFYLTTTGNPADPAEDTCFLFAGGAFTGTRLRRRLDQPPPPAVPPPPIVPGPLDPAYAVCLDPADANVVFVGTVTGVWRGVRTPGTADHDWTPFVNGLPQATVQDLAVWRDPEAAAGAPRMLRAAVQSRGLWEVNLAGDEPRRTYVRVHAFDDRRIFPTPMRNPRRSVSTLPAFASPDVVIRPAAGPAAAPGWQLPGSTTIHQGNVPAYQLWTFQTAFRWIYPSVAATGTWSDPFGDLVELHRTVATPASPGRFIDRALWDAVVGGTRLTAAGAVSAAAGDPLAVYRAPWQSAAAPAAVATEVDVVELVRPTRTVNDVWRVFRERSTVDVLVHHRDTRPLAANDAFAILLWRSAPSPTTLLNVNPSGIPAWAAGVAGGGAAAPPAGWNVAGGPLHRLPVPLDARLPRAIPIDLDLSGVSANHHVLLLALVGSSLDSFAEAPAGAVANMTALVQRWPYAAMRIVRVATRS